MNVGNADIHEAADGIGISGDTERYRWFVGCGTAPKINNEPRVRDLDESRRALAVARRQYAAAEDLFVKSSRPFDIGNCDKVRDGKSFLRRHLIGFLLDLHFAHARLLFWTRAI